MFQARHSRHTSVLRMFRKSCHRRTYRGSDFHKRSLAVTIAGKEMKQWKETCWQEADESNTIVTISQVLHLLRYEQIVLLRLEELSHIKDLSLCEHRIAEADLSCPIIVSEKDGPYKRILDGHHRRAKAVLQNDEYIFAKILKFSCIPVQFQWLAN